jgi:uncharacterized protein (DUF362 family)/NAD-dependent dihydropyrimidine dehydrogenase PreA subunit
MAGSVSSLTKFFSRSPELVHLVADHCRGYEGNDLRNFFLDALTTAGITCDHCKVLLKPNLLSGKAPEKAVNTHPDFIKALAEVLLEKGCSVFVGDSPGYETTEKALKRSGIMDVVDKLGLGVATFDKKVVKQNRGISPYREIVLGEDPADYDVIINLPKLKTHMMMGLTAGVKNIFGFIPALRKAQWHLRCGTDSRLFASLLIDIYLLVKPTITILDGIIAMDTDGPSHGRLRNLGLVTSATDALAMDAYLETFLHIPYYLPITSVAKSHGLIPEYSLVDKGVVTIDDFVMPATMSQEWGGHHLVREVTRQVFTKKPKCTFSVCNACKTCVNVCASGAVTFQRDKITFDYGKCIRCYCCAEMCPTGAIKV